MRITSKNLRDIRADLAKKLKVDVQFEESEVKKNGAYLDIIYTGSGTLSRVNCFYANCDLVFTFMGAGGNFDVTTARIMSLESEIVNISFMTEGVQNIEKYQLVSQKLRYGIIHNEDEADRELDGNKLTYTKTYEMKIFIGV